MRAMQTIHANVELWKGKQLGVHVEILEHWDGPGTLVLMLAFRGPTMTCDGSETIQQVWDAAKRGDTPGCGEGWTVGRASDGCYMLARGDGEARVMLKHLAFAGAYKLRLI